MRSQETPSRTLIPRKIEFRTRTSKGGLGEGFDLLIIDDLGTELTNSFVASQFFLCINERILRKKSTVISTNLTLGSFMDTYSERVFSRVSSNYTMIKLIGKDIRIQKKILGGN